MLNSHTKNKKTNLVRIGPTIFRILTEWGGIPSACFIGSGTQLIAGLPLAPLYKYRLLSYNIRD